MSIRLRQLFAMRSIRLKLTIVSVVCILLPSIITILVYNALTQDAVRKQAIHNSQESLMLVNGYVTNQLKFMLNIANFVQLNTEMNAYFKQTVSGQAQREDTYTRFSMENAIRKQLESLAYSGDSSRESVNGYITVLLMNGSSFASYPIQEFDPDQFRKQSWYQQVQNMQGLQSYWISTSPTVFSSERDTDPYQISVVRALRNDGNRIYGLVIVTMLENQLSEVFRQRVGQEEVMIVDSSNRILSASDGTRIGKQLTIPASTDSAVSSVVLPVGSDLQLVTQLPITFTGWRLVSIQPYRSATVDISSIFGKVFVFQLLSFLIFLILFLILVRKLLLPLARLGKTAMFVQMGNLHVRAGIRGADEIGRLGTSFDGMLDRIEEMIEEISLTQTRKRKAELSMLQAQIKPHFLFNVLNSIRMRVMLRGDRDSANMIGSLSKLLRMTIVQENGEIPLAEELELVTDYLKLMNLRQQEEVRLELDIAPEALLLEVPRFCLQPIIENAIIHGLQRRAGTIRIRASLEEDWLRIAVEDYGRGMTPQQLETIRGAIASPDGQSSGGQFSGIGLPNVAERMRMTFGEGFRMNVDSAEDQGAAVLMTIPLRKEASHV